MNQNNKVNTDKYQEIRKKPLEVYNFQEQRCAG